ncbi:MAG TPA: sigma-70 family RNA polymerase sigma factor [Nitrospinota bacterium]|nr:sigma-70 family RNA polymerase sigma factor [Nitrospinota bacterium]|tara:strand:- start:35433 stop:36428 length:996 start_codon:yes stop_codon:yes gene_type:complete
MEKSKPNNKVKKTVAQNLEGSDPSGTRNKSKVSPANNDASKSNALAPSDPLQLYISKAKNYPALSREEEFRLAKLYRETGDKEAAFILVTSNLMLVVKIAFEFRTQFQNILDLIQEGNYGLMRAVRKFDPFKGTRLSTYSAYWIRAYIIKFLLDNWRLVKVGTTNIRRKLLYNLKEMEAKLSEGGTVPSVKLLAEHFGASEEDVIEVQKSLGVSDASIHQPIEEGSSRTLSEILPATHHTDYAKDIDDKQIMNQFRTAIEEFKKDIRPSELTLLEERILSEDPLTLQEIGDKHDITREAVRQAEVRLLKKLTKYLQGQLGEFKDFGFEQSD